MSEVGVLTAGTGPSSVQPCPKLLYSREEAAQVLSVSVRTLDYLIAQKQIAVVRVRSRVLISYKELQRFARQGSTSVN